MDTKEPQPLAYTPGQILKSRLLPIGRTALYKALQDGTLPCVRIGKKVLIPAAGLHRLFADLAPASE
jgi:excisionase family DNA binding protein